MAINTQFLTGLIPQLVCAGVTLATRTPILGGVGFSFGALAILAVVLRCYSRFIISKTLQGDDFAIIATGCLIASMLTATTASSFPTPIVFTKLLTSVSIRHQVRLWDAYLDE